MKDNFLLCLKEFCKTHQIWINFLLKNVDKAMASQCIEKHCADFPVILPIDIPMMLVWYSNWLKMCAKQTKQPKITGRFCLGNHSNNTIFSK